MFDEEEDMQNVVCREENITTPTDQRAGGPGVAVVVGRLLEFLKAHSRSDDSTTGGKAMAARIDQTTSFSYTTYIHTTPDQVWEGLTAPALTKRYWRHHRAGEKTFHSDWRKGSTYDLAHEEVGLVVSDPEQVILESDPCRRLVYTWHTFTPEWAAQVGMDEFTADAWRAEPRSRVAFDIEDAGLGVVKLTVIHDGFEPGSDVLQAISQGWPAVLSSLKTLLESGSPLPWS
jgi:uncharacterized protein YndB with AHSA1/START domain